MHRLTVTTGAVVVLIVLLVTLVVMFRQPLTIAVINQYLRADHVRLNCLEFDFNWQLDVDVSQICVDNPVFKIIARKVRWTRESNRLVIDSISVTHTSNKEKSLSLQPITLALPANLPWLDINELQIHSDFTAQPLVLRVRQVSGYQFEISSGWRVTFELINGQLRGDIEWQLDDLRALGIPLDAADFAKQTLNSPVKTRFNFDGQTITSETRLKIDHNVEIRQCPIHLSGEGVIGLNADLLASSAVIDLRQFPAWGQWQDCSVQQHIPKLLRFEKFDLAFSELIDITRESIITNGVKATGRVGTDVTLQLDNLKYQFDGESSADFQLGLDRGAALHIDSSGNIAIAGEAVSLNASATLEMVRLDYQEIAAQYVKGDFELSYSPQTGIKGQGATSLKTLRLQDLMASDVRTDFNFFGANARLLKIRLDSKIAALTSDDLVLKKLTSRIDGSLLEQNRFTGKGTSAINDFELAGKSLGRIVIEHDLVADLDQAQIDSENKASIGKGFWVDVNTANWHAVLNIHNQPLSKVAAQVTRLTPQLTIQSGHISASIDADLKTSRARGKISVTDTAGRFDDIAITGLHYDLQFSLDSDGLQLPPARISAKTVNPGMLIANVVATVEGRNSLLQAHDIKGEVFDGTFSLDQLWLDGRDQRALLMLHDIDMATLVALEKQSGIEISGHLAGSLPLILASSGISIQDGHLHSQQDGAMRIKNNAAFESLKAQQPNIVSQLTLLEELNFEKLDSTVNMANDGVLNLSIAIVGFNPVAGERVNFNYTHQENVLLLLKTMRLTDTISDRIEQRLHP